MKIYFKTILITVSLILCVLDQGRAQTVKIIGSDIANGAITGAALGAATMALQNSGGLGPLRFGLGAGIIYGIGIGIYDVSIVPKGQRFYTSATFNSGHNSTIIVLLDTIYGAAGGAVVGAAISLLSGNSVVAGLQYGSGAGTWLGFGFGLVDSFVLAQGPRQLRAAAIHPDSKKAPGMISLSMYSNKLSLGFLHPTVFSYKVFTDRQLMNEYSMGVNVLNVKVGF